MTGAVSVRRIRLHEWREVRDLRIEAVSDPAASMAFLSTRAEELSREDAFWRGRAAGGALGETAAQFVAVTSDDDWVGTVTVLLREIGTRDHLDRVVEQARADVVGVYLAPAYRGQGVLADLFAAAADWAHEQGAEALTLDVHADNARAHAAYRKLGFSPTGVTFTSSIGAELEMRRPI